MNRVHELDSIYKVFGGNKYRAVEKAALLCTNFADEVTTFSV
ncbi:hypothetical protein ACVRWJ_09810 [Streptococcus thoraltensis]